MMIPFNPDIHQCVKWQQNKATGIQGVIDAKATWYAINNTQFWDLWKTNVFDLRTATPFGLMVWCIILGVPSASFGLYPAHNSFAFGNQRQNFVYGGLDATIPDKNLVGGNFYGGGQGEILDFNEVRRLLQTRYVALVSNGSLAFINRMLRYIWNADLPWDFPGGRYMYMADNTLDTSAVPVASNIWRTDWQGKQRMYDFARANLLWYSELFTNAAWTKSQTTVTAAAGTAPDGTNTAFRLAETAVATSTFSLRQDRAVVANTTVTVSIYAKAAEVKIVGFRMYGNVFLNRSSFDLVNGVVLSPNGGTGNVTSTITAMGNGWYRCTSTFSPDAGATISGLQLETYDDAGNVSHTGLASRGVLLWGGEMKNSTLVSSYIKTPAGAAVSTTDYTLNSTGLVTFAVAPLAAAILAWNGTWGSGATTGDVQFGTGNGSTTAFQLPKPVGYAAPIVNAFDVQLRIGPNMGLSSQAVNVLNDPAMGVLPTMAGCKTIAIQE